MVEDEWEGEEYPESFLPVFRAEKGSPEGRARLAQALEQACHRACQARLAEKGVALRQELRALAEAHSDETAILEPWCIALYSDHRNAVLDAREEEGGRMLDEMRAVAESSASSAHVRERFANALYNAHWAGSEAEPTPRLATYLERLRLLEAVSGETAIGIHLARAVFNAHH